MTGFGKSKPSTNEQKISKNGSQLLESAVKAHKAGDVKNAEALYQNAINIGFSHEIAFSNLGIIYKNAGRKEEAVSMYKRAISINPRFAEAYLNLGNLLRDLGNLDEAISFTLKSLHLKPDNPDALRNLGGIYLNLDKLDQALTYTLKSLELKPDNATTHMNLGIIYKDLGQLNQALASTLKSLELKSDNPDAHASLGSIYFQNGELEKASVAFEKSLRIKKTPFAMTALSTTYSRLGRKEESMKYAISAVEIDKYNEKSLINLANQCADCDRPEQGINAAMKAIEINKKSENAYLAATRILCKQELLMDARRMLERAKENIGNSHIIDGELARVKFLEGLLDNKDNSDPWTDDEDFYYEECNGSNLIISFGSNGFQQADKNNIALFNFRRTLKFFTDHDKLYIRDLDRNYYMNGVRNSAPSILDLKNLILSQMRAKKYKTVTTIGASSGGFGALLYGNMVKADYMIAFNPQTVLDDERNSIIKDNIFSINAHETLKAANKADPLYRKCLNIKNFIPFKGKAIIHYSNNSTNGIDKRYAEYLKHENCTLIAHESATHLLALELKEKNTLITNIVRSLNPQEN